MREVLNRIPIVRRARERAAAYQRLAVVAEQHGMEKEQVGNVTRYTLPLDNVSYYDDAGVAGGWATSPYETHRRPLSHDDVDGQIVLYRRFGGRYRAEVTIHTVHPLRQEPFAAAGRVPDRALAPNAQKVRSIKHNPRDRYFGVYTVDRDRNAWSLHIQNPDHPDFQQ